jgi:hypothetical protein
MAASHRCRRQCRRAFHEHENWGPFARFVPALGFHSPWLFFLDDDFVPGSRAVEHLLNTAAALLGTTPGARPRAGGPTLGALGERGRRFVDGGYHAHEVPRSGKPERVDCLVRAHFLPTENLAHLVSPRAQQSDHFTPPVRDDDLILALALWRARLPIFLTPEDPDPATHLVAEELPEPRASSSHAGHLVRRDSFVRRWFPARAIPSPHASGTSKSVPRTNEVEAA